MATYYVDGVSGLDTNAGTSFATAFQTISKLKSVMVDGDTGIICATTTYTLTASVVWTVAGTAANGGLLIQGGNATGTVDGTQPTITSSTASTDLFQLTAATFHRFKYLKFTHTGSTRGNAFACVTTAPNNIALEGITVDGCLSAWQASGRDVANLVFSDCLFQNCTGVGIVNGGGTTAPTYLTDVTIYNCTSHGITTDATSALYNLRRCILAKNGGKNFYDTGTTRTVQLVLNDCTIVDAVSDGIRSDEGASGSFQLIGENNIIWGNGTSATGWGVIMTTQTQTNTDARKLFRNNFYGSNTSGNLSGLSAGAGDVTGLTDPFVSRATQNWGLNNTAGAGALVRAAGFPGTFRGTNTRGYLDGGAVQHQDAGGGSGGGAPIIGSAIVCGLGRIA